MNGVGKKVFSGPFCLGVTRKTREAEGNQIDAKEAAKKSDGAKTRSWAGGDPTFRPFGAESDPWGRSRPATQHMQRRVFWPRRHRERKEKGTRREEGKSKC